MVLRKRSHGTSPSLSAPSNASFGARPQKSRFTPFFRDLGTRSRSKDWQLNLTVTPRQFGPCLTNQWTYKPNSGTSIYSRTCSARRCSIVQLTSARNPKNIWQRTADKSHHHQNLWGICQSNWTRGPNPPLGHKTKGRRSHRNPSVQYRPWEPWDIWVRNQCKTWYVQGYDLSKS